MTTMTERHGRAPAHITHCTDCGQERSHGIPLNRAGRCGACGMKAAVGAALGMAKRAGPYYEKWYSARWGSRGK